MRFIILLSIISSLASCGNVRQFQYLQGRFDTAAVRIVDYPKPVFQANDILKIDVYSDDIRASAYYNSPEPYLVDKDGNIHFAGVGVIQVAGLNKPQLQEALHQKLNDKLKNPVFNIKLMNFRIILTGEINQPGQYAIPTEKISILEAIGRAGDIASTGRRDNIMIVREVNGQRTFGSINLLSPDAFKSPFYHLLPNDVVYISPNKNKTVNEAAIRNFSLATTVISVLAVLISVL